MSLPHSIRASPHRKHCTESQTTGNLTGDTHTYSLVRCTASALRNHSQSRMATNTHRFGGAPFSPYFLDPALVPSQIPRRDHSWALAAPTTISDKCAMPENKSSNFFNSRSRFCRSSRSSAITKTLSKNRSTTGRRVEISSRAPR